MIMKVFLLENDLHIYMQAPSSAKVYDSVFLSSISFTMNQLVPAAVAVLVALWPFVIVVVPVY
jgi:hypothetical protein